MATKSELRQWCDRHWQPYREGRASALVASLMLMQAFLNDERTMRLAGWNPETGAKADVEKVNGLLVECAPICCFLGDDVMDRIFAEAGSLRGPTH